MHIFICLSYDCSFTPDKMYSFCHHTVNDTCSFPVSYKQRFTMFLYNHFTFRNSGFKGRKRYWEIAIHRWAIETKIKDKK